MTPEVFDIVFDGPPGPNSARLVEIENMQGESIQVGRWIERGDGTWVLRIDTSPEQVTVTLPVDELLALPDCVTHSGSDLADFPGLCKAVEEL